MLNGLAQDTGGGNPFGLLPIVLIAAVFWFMIIGPQRRRDKERRAMLAALAKGDAVVTSGGICGTILAINDKTVVLKVNDDPVAKIEFVRGAVTQVVPKEEKEEKDSK
jgi:preprotein translocase subunit YajC